MIFNEFSSAEVTQGHAIERWAADHFNEKWRCSSASNNALIEGRASLLIEIFSFIRMLIDWFFWGEMRSEWWSNVAQLRDMQMCCGVGKRLRRCIPANGYRRIKNSSVRNGTRVDRSWPNKQAAISFLRITSGAKQQITDSQHASWSDRFVNRWNCVQSNLEGSIQLNISRLFEVGFLWNAHCSLAEMMLYIISFRPN